MTQSISVMGVSAIRLACAQYGDATAFVQILQANQLTDDWFINEPVVTSALAGAAIGTNILVVPPTIGINIEDLVYSPSIDTYSIVTSVTQNYQAPGGQPFCLCHASGEPPRYLPNLGTWLSTTITISPSLDNAMNVGTPLTFAVGQGQKLLLPPQPSPNPRGIPS